MGQHNSARQHAPTEHTFLFTWLVCRHAAAAFMVTTALHSTAANRSKHTFLSTWLDCRQMTFALPMSPLVLNLMPSLVTLSSTGGKRNKRKGGKGLATTQRLWPRWCLSCAQA